MLVIELRFPAGRYHATPWGRHVNEGAPEWPPSPYRLIRGLYDVWRRKRSEWPETRVMPLLKALASAPPSFLLPPASASHTRSFLSENTEDPNDRKLIFDAFVALAPRAQVLIGWAGAPLSSTEEADLDELLSLLNYLGRSESWVAAGVIRGVRDVAWNCHPSTAPGDAEELVPVACAVPFARYEASPAFASGPKKKGKTTTSTRIEWLDALGWSTSDLMAARRSEPPAFEQVSYARSSRCFDLVRSPKRPTERASVHGVLCAFESKVLPLVTATLEVAERVRRKLMGIHKRISGDSRLLSARFSGKDPEGNPLQGHRHVYVLPIDRDRDGRLDHLLIVCREPLEHDERLALDRLRSIWQANGKPDLRVIPIQWGRLDELLPPRRRFVSATPFVPARHYRQGRGALSEWLAEEVRREASNHGLPAPTRVAMVPKLMGGARDFRWIEFRRSRKGDRVRPGYGFSIEFAEPVAGPVALGYGAHFGLGLFLSDD